MPLIVAYRNGAAVRLSEVGDVVDSVQDLRNAGFNREFQFIIGFANAGKDDVCGWHARRHRPVHEQIRQRTRGRFQNRRQIVRRNVRASQVEVCRASVKRAVADEHQPQRFTSIRLHIGQRLFQALAVGVG